ncbi:glycosyl transferase family 1 [Ruegeria sp. ANG-R]|nr:glycosyl transferase family 1 [Ruegeria sp. ANG-R]
MTSPRVLLIAEAANPEWVSVPLVGWSLCHALKEVADVHLVTHIRNRDAILRAGYTEGEDFTIIDSEAVAKPMYQLAQVLRMGRGKGWTMNTAINALSYPYFEHLVWKRFGPEIRAGGYDIVHRVTPLTPTTVSPIAAKCEAADVPFVVGPINGGVPWPKGFDAERRREREWLSYVRSAYKAMPGRRRMLSATSAFIAGSKHTASEIPEKHQDRVHYIPENAIDTTRFNRVARQNLDGPLRAVFIGRLVPYKGLDMGVEAAREHLASGAMRLDVIGDGPMRATIEEQVRKDGLAETVTFHGKVPHEVVQDIAVQSNILLFPSIREFGGGVVLEAMSLGLVPMIVDYAGPSELVTPETGFAVPIAPKAAIVSTLRQTLDSIVADRSVLSDMAVKARQRVSDEFTWPVKARKVVAIYDSILADRTS